jgi:hypothetical protein
MSDFDRNLKEQLTKHSDAHQAPYAWQEQVWRQLAKPPEKRWKPGFAHWPIVAMASVMLILGGGVYFQTTDQFRSFYGVHMERLAVAVSLKIMSPASAVVGLQAFAHLPTIPLCVGLGLLFVECEEAPVAH